MGIPLGPQVHHHEGQGRAKKVHLNKWSQALRVQIKVSRAHRRGVRERTMKAKAPNKRNQMWSATLSRKELDSSILENLTLQKGCSMQCLLAELGRAVFELTLRNTGKVYGELQSRGGRYVQKYMWNM